MSYFYRAQNIAFSVLFQARLPLRLLIGSGRCGFFGDVFMALNGIRFAETNRARAMVNWRRKSLYFDEETERNVWDLCFEQSSFDFTSQHSCLNSIDVGYRPSAQTFASYEGHSVISSLNRAINNWCRPRGEIKGIVDQFVGEHFRCGAPIGVHVRLTDAALGFENRAPASVDDFIKQTCCVLDKFGDKKIFLASDEEFVVERFRSVFGQRVVVRNALRSIDGRSIHGHYDKGLIASGNVKAVDVLVDALILARCDIIIRSHSRVTAFSLCMNNNLKFVDLDRLVGKDDRLPWLGHSSGNALFSDFG